MRFPVLALAAMACAVPAKAEWHRASSRHFIIYSEQNPGVIRQFAEELEKFDGAVRRVRGMEDLPPSQGNRLTIFSTFGTEEIERLRGDSNSNTRGFYSGKASGSVAFVSRGNSKSRYYSPVGSRISTKIDLGVDDNVILFHEYAHHLMMQDLVGPTPVWFVEGFAEFMSTAQIERDGAVGLGLPATHRYYGLMHGAALPLRQMLSTSIDELEPDQVESLYGRGWLLTHYLTFEPSRKGQLDKYLTLLGKNSQPLAAAESAFGNLDVLEGELKRYQAKRSLDYLKVSKNVLNVGPISVDRLDPGAAEIVPLLMQAQYGLDLEGAQAIIAQARQVQARHPGDVLAHTMLAQVELAAEQAEAAEAAADRALALAPGNLDATILKGKAMVLKATKLDGAPRHALFERARKTFIAANAIDREDPEPLMEFYHAYGREGIGPNKNAIAALHYASDLAPQDRGLRVNSAYRYLVDGKLADAKHALLPIAFDPHGGHMAKVSREMIVAIDRGEKDRALELARTWSNTPDE